MGAYTQCPTFSHTRPGSAVDIPPNSFVDADVISRCQRLDTSEHSSACLQPPKFCRPMPEDRCEFKVSLDQKINKITFKTSPRHIARPCLNIITREGRKKIGRDLQRLMKMSRGEETRFYHTCDLLVALKIWSLEPQRLSCLSTYAT